MVDGFLPHRFPVDDPERLAAREDAHASLATSVRHLIDLTVRSSVDDDELYAVATAIDALCDRLAASANPGALGLRVASTGHLRNEGNPMVGRRNPVAPPLAVHHDGPAAWAEMTTSAQHEGPPGFVHGGVTAMLLDQVTGSVAAWEGRPGMTAYLNLTYRRPTPLGPIRCDAGLSEISGRKTTVVGEIRNADGEVTVEAEALFVTPQEWLDRAASMPSGDVGELPSRD